MATAKINTLSRLTRIQIQVNKFNVHEDLVFTFYSHFYVNEKKNSSGVIITFNCNNSC